MTTTIGGKSVEGTPPRTDTENLAYLNQGEIADKYGEIVMNSSISGETKEILLKKYNENR
jgi:hypothetical protein